MTGEIAQWLKCLLCKPEDWTFIPSSQVKLNVGEHICNLSVPTTKEGETGDSLEAYVPASLMFAAENDSDTLSNKVEGNDQYLGPLTSTCVLWTRTYLHTCKHRNVNSYYTCTYTSYTYMYTYIKI